MGPDVVEVVLEQVADHPLFLVVAAEIRLPPECGGGDVAIRIGQQGALQGEVAPVGGHFHVQIFGQQR